jgi:hypothetical protein
LRVPRVSCARPQVCRVPKEPCINYKVPYVAPKRDLLTPLHAAAKLEKTQGRLGNATQEVAVSRCRSRVEG